eukprot:7586558-Pyramimonas_sp.AAC.2
MTGWLDSAPPPLRRRDNGGVDSAAQGRGGRPGSFLAHEASRARRRALRQEQPHPPAGTHLHSIKRRLEDP